MNHDPQLSCVSTEIAYYDQQISSSPDMTEDYVCRARLYMGKKEWDKAADDLDKAVDLNPKYASAFIWRGSVNAQMNRKSQAISDYRLCRTYSTTTGLKNMAESALAKLGAK